MQKGEWTEKQLTGNLSPYQVKVFTGDGGSIFIYYSGFPCTEAILRYIVGRIKFSPDAEARKSGSYNQVLFNANPIFRKFLESDKIVSHQIGRPVSNVSNGLGIFASTCKNGTRYWQLTAGAWTRWLEANTRGI